MVVRRRWVRDCTGMAVLDRTTLALDRVRDVSTDVRIGDRWRPSAAWAGPMVTLALAVALELLRGKGLRVPDPAAVFLVPVAASALLGGLRVGLLAGGIAAAASLVTLADRPFVTMPDNSLRALETLVFLPAMAALVGWARDRLIAIVASSTNEGASSKGCVRSGTPSAGSHSTPST